MNLLPPSRLRKSLPGHSYFADCPRDEGGHCKPSGEANAIHDILTPPNRPETNEDIARVRQFKELVTDWLGGLVKEDAGDIPTDKIKNVQHGMAKVCAWATPAMLDRIRKNLGAVVLYPDIDAITNKVRSEDAHFPTNAKCGGFFLSFGAGRGSLHVDGGYDGSEESAHHIYAHEIGHVIDGAGHVYSNDPNWVELWRSEIDQSDNPLSAYARTSPAEGFAEFFRLLLTGQYKDARLTFPECYSYLRGRGLL